MSGKLILKFNFDNDWTASVDVSDESQEVINGTIWNLLHTLRANSVSLTFENKSKKEETK